MKIASLLFAAADWMAMARSTAPGGVELGGGFGICILFGLLCVWFAEYLGAFIGPIARGGFVNAPTPAPIFVLLGWLFLCAPLAAFAYLSFSR